MPPPVDDRPIPTTCSVEDVEQLMVRRLPRVDHHGEIVEEVDHEQVRIRLPFQPAFLGADEWQDGSGAVFSGPLLMGLADTAMYCAAITAAGTDAIPVMTNLTIAFLRPARPGDLIAETKVICRGGRLSFLECWITSDGQPRPCAHATATYRIARA